MGSSEIPVTFFKPEKCRDSMGKNPFTEKTAYYLGTENSNSEWLRRFIIKHNRHPANRVPNWELPRLRMIVDILSRIEKSKSDDIMNIIESISETDFPDKKTTTQEVDKEIKRVEDAYPKAPTLTNTMPIIEFVKMPGADEDDEPALDEPALDEPALDESALDEPALDEFDYEDDEPYDIDDEPEIDFTSGREEPNSFFIQLDSMFGREIEEYFDWPSTEVTPSWFGLSNLDSSEWAKIGVLKRMGYAVGSKDGISDHGRRCELLDFIFLSSKLPFVHSYEHMRDWGAASSSTRLKKMANSMATFGRNMRRKEYFTALEKYDKDLAYLKDRYYDPGFSGESWNWPNTKE